MASGNSYTKNSGSAALLKQGVKSFNIPLFGGFDGLDISVVDPFSSAVALSGQNNKSHYAHYSIDKAIEIAADPESIKYDVDEVEIDVNPKAQKVPTLSISRYPDRDHRTYKWIGVRELSLR